MKIKILLAMTLSGWLCAGCELPGLPGPGTSQELLDVELIDRSLALGSDDSRMKILVLVAQRPTIDPVVQVYLVDRVSENLSLGENKTQVFLMLIRNPAFSQGTRQAILARLNETGSERNKAQILQALDQRGNLGW